MPAFVTQSFLKQKFLLLLGCLLIASLVGCIQVGDNSSGNDDSAGASSNAPSGSTAHDAHINSSATNHSNNDHTESASGPNTTVPSGRSQEMEVFGIVATGFAQPDVTVSGIDADGNRVFTVITDHRGVYTGTFKDAAFPILIHAQVDAQTRVSNIVFSSNETEVLKHLNPVTAVATRTVLGPQIPDSFDTPLRNITSESYQAVGSALMDDLVDGIMTFELFDTDQSFTPRIAAEPQVIPSSADVLLDAFQEYARDAGQSSIELIESRSSLATPLLREPQFQVVFTSHLSQYDGVFRSDAIVSRTAPIFATLSNMVSIYLSALDKADVADLEASQISLLLRGLSLGTHQILEPASTNTVSSNTALHTLSHVVSLLDQEVVDVITTYRTENISEDALLAIVENSVRQASFVIGHFDNDDNPSSHESVQDAAQNALSQTASTIFQALDGNTSITRALASVEESIQQQTNAVLEDLCDDNTLTDAISEFENTCQSLTTAPDTSITENTTCTVPDLFVLPEGSLANQTASIPLNFKNVRPPAPGRQIPKVAENVSFSQDTLSWDASENAQGYTILECGTTTSHQWELHTFDTIHTSVAAQAQMAYLLVSYATVPLITLQSPFTDDCQQVGTEGRCYGEFASFFVE